jgi:hypothetical protein
MNIDSSKIPSKNDWGDLSDRDVFEAFEYFSDKSNDELQIAFKSNVLQRCSNLRWMPIYPFSYYIFGLKQYIESNDYGLFDLPDAVSCFIELVEEKAVNYQDEMKIMYPKLKGFIEHLVSNQIKYEADVDIYGDFKENAARIARLLE